MCSFRSVRHLLVLLAAAAGSAVWILARASTTVHAEGAFTLRRGDRVVFYGDSITQQRLYTTFVEDYVVTRFPRLNVRFVTSGWNGDRVTGGMGGPINRRLERDVIAYRPTVLTIMLGMNDGGYRPYDPALFESYAQGYRQIVRKVRQALPGVRLTLLQPSPYDDFTRPRRFRAGYNPVLVRYGRYVQELGAQQAAIVADLNTPVAAALQRAAAIDPAEAPKIIPDRIHPAPAGHLLLAAALLQAWDAPRIVAAVAIDAGSLSVTQQENTQVLRLRGGADLSWIQRDEALPLPLDLDDPLVHLARRASDAIDALDQQPLRITRLPAPRYALKIDGERIGVFTREELHAGINLALLPTPMARQAARVHELTVCHNEVHFARWRRLQMPLQDDPSSYLDEALPALDRVEEELVRQQRAAAEPQPHRYEVVPLPEIPGSSSRMIHAPRVVS